jgi:tetratricopeptide (TPR) repeat protein
MLKKWKIFDSFTNLLSYMTSQKDKIIPTNFTKNFTINRSFFFNLLDFITKKWMVLTTIVTLCGIMYYHIDPGYYFHSIGFQQQQNQIQEQQTILKNEFVDFHNKLGIKFLYVEQIDAARKEFDQVLKVDPLNQNATKGLFECDVFSRANNESYDPEISYIELNTLKEKNPDDPLPYLYLGDFDYNHNLIDDASDNYLEAIKRDNSVVAAYNGIGIIYAYNDKSNLALDMFDKAVKLSRWNIIYRNNLACTFYKLKRYQNATSWFNDTLILKSHSLETYIGFANSERCQGNLETALRLQEKQIGLLEENYTENISSTAQMEFYYTDSGNITNLHSYDEKKYYIFHDIALTYYLLGDVTKSQEYCSKANDLHINKDSESNVKAVLNFDIKNLQESQPRFTDRINEFKMRSNF